MRMIWTQLRRMAPARRAAIDEGQVLASRWLKGAQRVRRAMRRRENGK
ncbi:hypothetical protein [Sphingopyxis sp. RIFCSPHIGHO2_12_FULL_65_19]|nr:hypothetical protein [Sphingopyxis sp. RIFCSPHIGHO2_12_FULL_65_19]